MKKLITLFLLVALFTCSKEVEVNQVDEDTEISEGCLTPEPSFKDMAVIKSLVNKTPNYRASNEINFVPMKLHIIRTSEGYTPLTDNQIQSQMDNINGKFGANPLNVNFYLCGGINYIDDDTFYSFSQLEESSLRAQHYVDGMINVFVSNIVDNACGYAYIASSNPFTIMANNCFTNGSTFPHEIGHVFGLAHTHGYSNFGTTNELVDGSNCSFAGDYICDTPADPRLNFANVNSSCTYTGTATDANGDLYAPSTSNMMSYSRKQCRNEFTLLQLERMLNVYNIYFDDFTCEDKPVVVTRPEDAECYAKSVVLYEVGKNGRRVKTSRQSPNNALGEPQESEGNHTNFVTLGYGGELILDFEGAVPNLEGNDIKIFETNWNNNTCNTFPEYVNISVSQDGNNWSDKIIECNDDPLFDISSVSEFEWIRYIKLDTKDIDLGNNDGFDVDAVKSLHTCDDNVSSCYANFVLNYTQGVTNNGSPLQEIRTDASKALGVPEDDFTLNFVTLGYGGSITLGFDNPIINQTGNDFQVIETSWSDNTCEQTSNNNKEYADVYVSKTNSNWTFVKNVCINDEFINIPNELDFINYIKIVSDDLNSTQDDGFDVDGIIVLNCN